MAAPAKINSVSAETLAEMAPKAGLEDHVDWFKEAITSGEAMGLFDNSKNITHDEDKIMPIFHKFMAKSIQQDVETGQPVLVGTMIQQVCGLQFDEALLAGADDSGIEFHGRFKWRFNDVSARPEQIEARRSVPIPDFGMKTTYNCQIPLEKRLIFGVPPYELYEFKALIEMSTTVKIQGDSAFQVRPNIMVNPDEERELFIIRKENELDKLDEYNLVTPSARVTATYDKSKKYCPKYKVVFYASVNPMYKFVTTWIPLLLVAVLMGLNVMSQERAEGPLLENSIALALTIVFVLPELNPKGDDEYHGSTTYLLKPWTWFGANELSILFICVGLILSSLTHDSFLDDGCERDINGEMDCPYGSGEVDAKQAEDLSQYYGWVGIGCYGFAMLLPIYTTFKYWSVVKKIQNSAYTTFNPPEGTPSRNSFVSGGSFHMWNVWNEKKKMIDTENSRRMRQVIDLEDDSQHLGTTVKSGAWQVKKTAKETIISQGPNWH